jgi:hypothetical protein
VKKRTHGGARKGAGRPPAEDKTDHVVYFRLDSEQHAAAVVLAEKAGRSVHSLAKHLLLTAAGRDDVEVRAGRAMKPSSPKSGRLQVVQ